VARSTLPLVFFRGGYGRFTPTSLAAAEPELNGGAPARTHDHRAPRQIRHVT
jgi:hypothetical protein